MRLSHSLQHSSSKESLQGVNYRLTVCTSSQKETKQTTSEHEALRSTQHSPVMNSTVTISTTEKPRDFLRNIPTAVVCTESSSCSERRGTQAGGRRARLLHSPLSCMTTPKCVLGVLSSGALGGAEMTGGLEGFLLEVGLFSEAGRKKRKSRG